MKVFAVFLSFALTALSTCVGDLPPYCGVGVEDYPAAEGTLRQAHLVIRHGDRIQASPGKCWKGDSAVWDCLLTEAVVPTINRAHHYLLVERLYRKVFDTGREEVPGNCALGQLTSIGAQQQIGNGENYRKIYVDSGFLSTNFSSVEHFVRSTDIFRTLQSAQMFMTGMFPPSAPVEGRASIMDINTMDETYEDMVPNIKLCPKLQEYMEAYFQSPQFILHYKETSAQLVEDLQTALDDDTLVYKDVFLLFDCLNAYLCHGREIPPGITQDLYQRVVDETTYVVNHLYDYPTMEEAAKVGIGFFVKEIFQEIEDMMAHESKRKFILYSGHDITIMTLQLAFNITDGVWPPYASQMIFEVYEMVNKSFSLRILYNGKVQKLPFCDNKEMCDMDTVQSYVATIEPESVEKNCGSSSKMNV